MSNKLFYSIHGVKIFIQSEDEKFNSYVKQDFEGFKVISDSPQSADINIFFKGYHPFYKKRTSNYLSGFSKLSNELYTKEDEFLWINKAFNIHVKFGKKYEVIGEYYERIDHFFRKIKNKDILQNNYQNIVRLMVHYPLASYFQMFQNKLLIHGSSVEKNGEGILFVGFNGVGKSTLASYFTKFLDFNMIADNYTLYDSNQIYSFPETKRLKKDSMRFLDEKNTNFKENNTKKRFSIKNRSNSAKVKAVVILMISGNGNFSISPVSAIESFNCISTMHNFTKEFPEYNYFSALPYLKNTNQVLMFNNSQSLFKLLDSVKCFKVSLGKDQDLKKVSEVLLDEVYSS